MSGEVAVVMVTANSFDDIERILAELCAQEGVSLDVVIVDNGSDDGTLDVVRSARWVDLIENGENRWLSPAWAQGVRATSSPFILFLTPDVSVSDQSCIRCLCDVLVARPGAAMAGPRLYGEDGRDLRNGSFALPTLRWLALDALGLTRAFRRGRRPAPLPPDDHEPRAVAFVNGCCMLVRRSALEAIGGLDERYRLYWEEIDLARRLGEADFEILLAPSVRAVHRGKGSAARTGLREEAWAFGEHLYLRKHYGMTAAALISALRAVERGRRVLGWKPSS